MKRNRIGRDPAKVEVPMIFDLVLNSAFDLEGEEENYGFQIPRICEHCHRRILGRQYIIGKYFYDKYCYQFRWVIEKAHDEEDRKIELKKRKLLENN
jgi:hypothetical protein